MFEPLQTPRLLLRAFRDTDLEPLMAYRNDPEVYRYQGWKTPFSRISALEFIANMKDVRPGTPGVWMQIAIECRDANSAQAGLMIGDVAFHITMANPRFAYLGYSLARSAWGQGYAYEAVSKTLTYLFGVLNLHRVVAACDVDNATSVRLLERLHFRREAHYIENFWLEKECVWGSEYLYAMLQKEWLLK